MKVKQYPGRAVLVGDTGGAEDSNHSNMELLYESSWENPGWKTQPTKLYTNYRDWLQDGTDSNSDSEESINRYLSGGFESYPNHYYDVNNDASAREKSSASPENGRCLQNGFAREEAVFRRGSEEYFNSLNRRHLHAKNENSRLNKADGGKDVRRSPSAKSEPRHQRAKTTKLERLIARNGGHDLEPKTYEEQNGHVIAYEGGHAAEKWNGAGKPTIKYSKSMRSLKDPDNNQAPRPNLKHSKSMRSLKNRDMQRADRNSVASEASRFSSNTLRRILKLPEILRSSGNLSRGKEQEDQKSFTASKSAPLLKGFENPGVCSGYEDSPEERLSKLLVNSQPFFAASQSRIDAYNTDGREYSSPYGPETGLYANLPAEITQSVDDFYRGWSGERRESPRQFADGADKLDVDKQLRDYYNKRSKDGKSIFKTLTLRLKKKMSGKEKSANADRSDEYERAGLYAKQRTSNAASANGETDSDFAIPRPKLIVPVHTYGIRKRRTGNMLQSVRTRSDDASPTAFDPQKAHHTSCPGKCPPPELRNPGNRDSFENLERKWIKERVAS